MRLPWRRRTRVDVVPLRASDPKDPNWIVEIDGVRIVSSVCVNKADALQIAHAVAESHQPSELFVHNANGVIADRSTFPRSSDPSPPKG